jgi:adenylate cyclase
VQPRATDSLDLRALGRELGFRYALEGAVRRAGATVRVSVQLSDAATGTHLWAESYDRELEGAGLLAVQDDVTDRVVATVADPYGVLVRSMASALRDRPLEELTASDLVLRFFAYWHQVREDEHARLRAALERRLEREPAHADGWACLARLYSHEHSHHLNPLPGSVPRARKTAERAVEIDPVCQMAWESLADASYFARDLGAFHTAAERAMSLNPRNTNTVATMAVLIAMAGDPERGVLLARRAMALNPHHPGWYQVPLVFDLLRRREYEQALQATKRINMPGFFWAHLLAAAIAGRLGRPDEARAGLESLRGHFPSYREELERYRELWIRDAAVWAQLVEGLAEAEALASATGTTT